jgi:hypothetical protein
VAALVPVASSSIAAVGYDAARRELTVRFAGGGTYVYSGVPARAHRDLLAAESIGGHFNREIRNAYPYRQV